MRPKELGAADLREWRDIQREERALWSPFLSPDFALIVDQARRDARVAVMMDGGRAVGYLPFQLDDHAGGLPVGATICDAQAVICRPGVEWNGPDLIAGAGLLFWRFDHLSVSQKQFVPFHHQVHRSPTIDLSAGHQHFLDTVRAQSTDLLQQVARRRRKLDREVGDVVTEWQSSTPDDDLAQLIAWKSAQYAATGVWDRFAHSWITEVVTLLTRTSSEACTGLLSSTRAGDRLVAVHFGLLGPGGLSWWFPAYDVEFGRYSPGLIQLVDLAELAADRGLPSIDLGRGEHGYKLRVATGFYDVAEGEVPASA